MSDTSQGPGWWQAADGKFYAPEQHPDYQAPAAAPVPPAPQAPPAAAAPPGPMAPPPQMGAPPGPMAAPPQMGAPVGAPMQMGYTPPPAKSGGKGCLIAVIVLVVVLVLGGIGFFVLIRKASDSLDSAVGLNACPFASNGDVSGALGNGWTGTQFGSLTGSLNTLFDNRVLTNLPNSASCNLSGPSTGTGSGSGQATKYDGGDAQAKFAAELTKAKGNPDTSGVVTVTGADYFLKDVSLGDQAFCTKPDTANPSGGVLARKGNTLVYVSLFDVGIGDTADATCDQAQKLATKILG